jgi:hypothetical protein
MAGPRPRNVSPVPVHPGRDQASGDVHDGTVRVWRLADGTPVWEPLTGHTGSVLAVAAGVPARDIRGLEDRRRDDRDLLGRRSARFPGCP